MSAQQLGLLWKNIEEAGVLGAAALRFLDTGVAIPAGNVLAGLDAFGQRHLCIPAKKVDLGREDKRSRGVTVDVRPLLTPQGEEVPFVDIHCRKPKLNALFEVVAAEIVAEIQKKPDSPFGTAHLVLERWRELLEPSEGTQLGPQQLAALLAELLLLGRLGAGGVPPVKFWLGPEKGTHDFVCGSVDFEVKSTLSTTGREVEIHGISQLRESPGTNLYLWWLRLRPSPGRGISVPAAVDGLLERGADAIELMGKLKKAGYLHMDAVAYRDTTFELVDSALYHIDDEFPRLLESSFDGGLPQQVTRIAYTINLDAPLPLSFATAAAEAVFSAVSSPP